jgi:arginine/serine-rich splicing factor 1/9
MARIYVGNLPMDVSEREVDDLFYKFGRIRSIEIKTPSRPPAFAFISFDDRRDADDAVHDRDGYRFDRERLRVEFAKDDRRGGDSGGGRGRDGGRDGGRGDPKRSPYRVTVSGLPDGASWQDLKDFMRCGGDIVYADVDKRGGGVVEYSNREDMVHAVKKNDGSEFDKSYGRSVVTCKAESEGRSVSRSRSDSRDRGRKSSRHSRSRSPDSRSRSPDDRDKDAKKKAPRDESRSRSKSPVKAKEADRSRSRSPSPK